MTNQIRSHIRANVVGYVALFFALGGGTAMALDGSNTVFSDDIVAGAVQSSEIADNNVRGRDILNGTVAGAHVSDNSLRGADVRGLTGADIADNSLRSADVRNGGLTGADIDEGTLFNDNSLGGEDIDESDLALPGGTPSADNVLSARVASNGALTGGIGAEGASKSTTGNYLADFDRPIVGACAATVSLADSLSGEATVFVPSEVFDSSAINVRTSTSSGVPSDRAFDVTVVC